MPRKTEAVERLRARGPVASMRPRPDAAENSNRAPCAGWRRRRASMRPRPDAAENGSRARGGAGRGPRFNEAAARCRGKPLHWTFNEAAAGRASMRPRPDAAENDLSRPENRERVEASMRPRPDAAENGAQGSAAGDSSRSLQ